MAVATTGSSIINKGADGTDNSKVTQQTPGTPAPAKNGDDAHDDGKSCGQKAGNGTPGVDGTPGRHGADGGVAGVGNQIKIDLDEMNGHYVLRVEGGHGGSGGPGGAGGQGQQGGRGGHSSDHCSGGRDAASGKGGRGGDGGNAQDGGNAGDIYITFKSGQPTFEATIAGGEAGTPGEGGPAGEPGAPGAGDLGGGDTGKTAKPGAGGQFFVNGKKQKGSE